MILLKLGNAGGERGPIFALSVTKKKKRTESVIVTLRTKKSFYFLRVYLRLVPGVMFHRNPYTGGT